MDFIRGTSVKISLFVVVICCLALTFRVESFVSKQHCFTINDEFLCYFVPNGADPVGDDWDKAWQLCRSEDSILPVIENKTVQRILDGYLRNHLLGQELWMAGKGTRSAKWHWLNGKVLQERKLLENYRYYSDIYDTQAIVNYELKMSARFPGDTFNYICQYAGGARCQSHDAVAFGKGCLKALTSEVTRWYEARNLCVDDGGDLPIFENPEMLNATQRFFDQMKNATGFWVGLRRQWWQWKKQDAMTEVKYSNWLERDNYVNRDCFVMSAKFLRWKQESCFAKRKFICQTNVSEQAAAEAASLNSKKIVEPDTMTATVLISIPLVIIIAVGSVIIAKKGYACVPSVDLPGHKVKSTRQATTRCSNGCYTELQLRAQEMKQKSPQLQPLQDQAAYAEPWAPQVKT